MSRAFDLNVEPPLEFELALVGWFLLNLHSLVSFVLASAPGFHLFLHRLVLVSDDGNVAGFDLNVEPPLDAHAGIHSPLHINIVQSFACFLCGHELMDDARPCAAGRATARGRRRTEWARSERRRRKCDGGARAIALARSATAARSGESCRRVMPVF